MKKFKTLILIVNFIACHLILNAQISGCSTPYLTQSINYSTGVDVMGEKLNYTQGDPRWKLITAPTGNPYPIAINTIPVVQKPDFDCGINTPALLSTLSQNSRWIGPYDGYLNHDNSRTGIPYIYEFNFEVCVDGYYEFSSIINADDELNLLLDNSIILANTYNSFGIPYPLTECFSFTQNVYLAAGSHKLIANHRSNRAKASININGSVKLRTGTNGLKVKSEQGNKNTIFGQFFTDENNGNNIIDFDTDNKLQGSHMGVSGVDDLIYLKNIISGVTHTTTIDEYGFYQFSNLPIGDYKLSKVIGQGLAPIIPNNGTTDFAQYFLSISTECHSYRRDFLFGWGGCGNWTKKPALYSGRYNGSPLPSSNYIGNISCNTGSGHTFEANKWYTLQYYYICQPYLNTTVSGLKLVRSHSISNQTHEYYNPISKLYYFSFMPGISDIGTNNIFVTPNCFNMQCSDCGIHFNVLPPPVSRGNSKSNEKILNFSKKNKVSKINIYPNPSNDYVNIEVDFTNASELDIKVIDLLGKIIYKNNSGTKAIQFTDRIDVSKLAIGTYIIYVNNEAHKFIKQ
jgi:hypothetical protein